MRRERLGDWMSVEHAEKFWPLDPRPEEVDIWDIAGALSRICRFGGHVRKFYSVAEHAYWVSYWCNEEDALWGLLHDAAEAYLGDMIRPLKRMPEFGAFTDAEDRIMRVICARFGLAPEMPESVHRADNLLLATEAVQLKGVDLQTWSADLPRPLRATLPGFSPEQAEALFLDRFHELRPEQR